MTQWERQHEKDSSGRGIGRASGRRIVVRAYLYRKPGQSGVNPQLPIQLTQGQFESSARLEIYRLNAP